MAARDRAWTRLEQALDRLEQAFDRSLQANDDVRLSDLKSENQRLSETLDSAEARNRELEGRLELADTKLESVVAELKSMLERDDAPDNGADKRS